MYYNRLVLPGLHCLQVSPPPSTKRRGDRLGQAEKRPHTPNNSL